MLDGWLLNEFKGKIRAHLTKNPSLKQWQNMRLSHPDWPLGTEKIEVLSNRRIYLPSMANFATILSISEEQIILNWDCCGREEFVKNKEGVYEFKQR